MNSLNLDIAKSHVIYLNYKILINPQCVHRDICRDDQNSRMARFWPRHTYSFFSKSSYLSSKTTLNREPRIKDCWFCSRLPATETATSNKISFGYFLSIILSQTLLQVLMHLLKVINSQFHEYLMTTWPKSCHTQVLVPGPE